MPMRDVEQSPKQFKVCLDKVELIKYETFSQGMMFLMGRQDSV